MTSGREAFFGTRLVAGITTCPAALVGAITIAVLVVAVAVVVLVVVVVVVVVIGSSSRSSSVVLVVEEEPIVTSYPTARQTIGFLQHSKSELQECPDISGSN